MPAAHESKNGENGLRDRAGIGGFRLVPSGIRHGEFSIDERESLDVP
jgi:hypothetical protein